ncbi:MAG: hypothetical protein FWD97_07040 [Defluviitaleaceae bacterium]|nr:hypothetical protein [Defluviitaleaceae bacterium]
MLMLIGSVMLVLVGLLFNGALNSSAFSDILVLIDVPSLAFVLIPLVVFSQLSGNAKLLRVYFSGSFKKAHQFSKDELEGFVLAVKGNMKVAIATGAVAFLVALVAGVLPSWLADYGNELFILNLMISILPMIYAIGIAYFVLFPVQMWAENRLKTLG